MDEESLTLDIIDTNSIDEESWNKFKEKYNNSKDNLCIDNEGNETQDLFKEIIDIYNLIPKNHKIIYIHSQKKIFAFALIHIYESYKIIDLVLLCGNRNKEILFNNKKLGIFLLDYIYDEYINNKYLLKIRPANDKLKNYYINWKYPTLNPEHEKYGLKETNKYLIYGNINLINPENIEQILYSFRELKNVFNILNIDIKEFEKNINDVDKRQFLLNEIKKSNNYSDSQKEQIYQKIININYYTFDDFLKDLYADEYNTKVSENKHDIKKIYNTVELDKTAKLDNTGGKKIKKTKRKIKKTKRKIKKTKRKSKKNNL